MKQTTALRDFYGRIIGKVETDTITGDKILRDFYGRILGYYCKKENVTKDFYKRIIGKGDILSTLLVDKK